MQTKSDRSFLQVALYVLYLTLLDTVVLTKVPRCLNYLLPDLESLEPDLEEEDDEDEDEDLPG